MSLYENMSEEYKAAGRYLCHLIHSALNRKKAAEKPNSVSWEKVRAMAARNSVEGISWLGAETLKELPPDSLCRQWKGAMEQTIYRQLHFDQERQEILAEMKREGLSYLPLKGIHIAGYYPRPGMRSMADNDILYGFIEEAPGGGYQIRGGDSRSRQASVQAAQTVMVRIMKERGYEVKNLAGNHDSYLKPPIYNFEMHRQLMGEGSPQYDYYKNPWKRAVRDESDPYMFAFSHEDEYIYFLAHGFKHFDGSGCGIRSVVDQYVFLQAKGDLLDMDYVRRELEKLGLVEFEEQLRRLAQAAFGPKERMEPEDERLLYYLLGCGTYGNIQVRVNRQVEKLAQDSGGNVKDAKKRYLYSRLFPSGEAYEEYYGIFFRHAALRPFLMPYRLIRGVVHNPKRLWNELKVWKKVIPEEDNAERRQKQQ